MTGEKSINLSLACAESAPISCAVFVYRHGLSMKIKAYLKPQCGWSRGVRAIMRKYRLEFEDINVLDNRANHEEMLRKSGQPLSPCVEIDGVMLADVSGEELENYLLANNLVDPNDALADEPTNVGCADASSARMATKTIRFF
jgi:monothiol glutaredoxin